LGLTPRWWHRAIDHPFSLLAIAIVAVILPVAIDMGPLL